MPSRKQRKRVQKERRHEYETVWVDSEGNELEEPPDELPASPARDTKRQQKRQQQSASRGRSTGTRPAPPPPSWRRAAKRSLMLGAVIFVLFAFLFHSKNGQRAYGSALYLSVLYTAIFVPFTYTIDRFTYRRWQRRMGEQPTKR